MDRNDNKIFNEFNIESKVEFQNLEGQLVNDLGLLEKDWNKQTTSADNSNSKLLESTRYRYKAAIDKRKAAFLNDYGNFEGREKANKSLCFAENILVRLESEIKGLECNRDPTYLKTKRRIDISREIIKEKLDLLYKNSNELYELLDQKLSEFSVLLISVIEAFLSEPENFYSQPKLEDDVIFEHVYIYDRFLHYILEENNVNVIFKGLQKVKELKNKLHMTLRENPNQETSAKLQQELQNIKDAVEIYNKRIVNVISEISKFLNQS